MFLRRLITWLRSVGTGSQGMTKERLQTRLAEIASGRCPRCGSRLFVSLLAPTGGYVACENQYDPTNRFNLAGNGTCTRMITSLQILEAETRRHGLEMPVL